MGDLRAAKGNVYVDKLWTGGYEIRAGLGAGMSAKLFTETDLRRAEGVANFVRHLRSYRPEIYNTMIDGASRW